MAEVEPRPTQRPLPVCWLLLLATGSAGLYGWIAVLSRHFEFANNLVQRPIPLVFGLFSIAFLFYLAAIFIAIRMRSGRRLACAIVVPAILFRLTLLVSLPIQEVDIYRYIWDGSVTVAGVSPFRYAPDEVRNAHTRLQPPSDLLHLVAVADESPAKQEILGRVDHGELTTIYPPVSQAIFALASLSTPAGATVDAHLLVFKAWFLVFDLGTLVLLLGLLRRLGMSMGWGIAYGWCPLVLKEFANSGHLDAIAVFLCMAAVYLVVRVLTSAGRNRGWLGSNEVSPQGDTSASHSTQRAVWPLSAAAALLALAVGAKLYPLVLVPLLASIAVRRLGWRSAAAPALVFVVITAAVMSPMLVATASRPEALQIALPEEPEGQRTESQSEPVAPSGLATFLRRWEMNDLLFMVVHENLKPPAADAGARSAWFAVVPPSLRTQLAEFGGNWLSVDPQAAAFLFARMITGALFLGIALTLARRAVRTNDPRCFLEAAFLTLAWFWLLAPTQNPWYWTWALPLIPFARNRVWLLMAGLVMIYYLRFWFAYQFPDVTLCGTPYVGKPFFDYVVTWFEFGPFLLLLMFTWVMNRRRLGLRSGDSSNSPIS